MKLIVAAAMIALSALSLHADDPPELKVIEAKYDPAQFTYDDESRAAYVLELVKLRFKLDSEGRDVRAVEAEIIRHPLPANSDSDKVSRLRIGPWCSARHEYRFEINGTWRMTRRGIDFPHATHGAWAINGAEYSETFANEEGTSATTFTLILADGENFIFTNGTHLFFEKRPMARGVSVLRDESAE